MNAVVETTEYVGEPVPYRPDLNVPQVVPQPTPMDMLQTAMERGADLATLEKLMDLQDRWEKKEAEKAYIAAITAFKQTAPEILKRKRVSFETSKGITEYNHAELSDVCEAAIKSLAAVGISHRWDIVEQTPQLITVECVLTHVAGHSQRTRLAGPTDTSGGKNAMQAIAAGVTYLERYTLLAATGLATKGQDTDGRAPQAADVITASQVADLEALITEVGANRAAYLNYCKVERIEDLPAAKYNAAVKALEARRKG